MSVEQIQEENASYNILLLSDIGVGKTSLLKTAKMPVLVHSFDPGGSRLALLRPIINSGEYIYDDRYEKESLDAPHVYKDWEQEFMRLKRGGAFEQIGTYVIDSFTTWMDGAKNELGKRKAGGSVKDMRPKKGSWEGILEKQDWQVLGQITIDMVKMCSALPCDFILTGHLVLIEDEVSGRLMVRFKSIPSLQVNIPLLFDEIYVMESKETPDGVTRSLITQNTGRYVARTRLGAGIFETRERADLGYLRQKAFDADK